MLAEQQLKVEPSLEQHAWQHVEQIHTRFHSVDKNGDFQYIEPPGN
ncbi:MAG: hypothetical protein ACSLEN_01120 [Candidatus Malihini olakiniferum]